MDIKRDRHFLKLKLNLKACESTVTQGGAVTATPATPFIGAIVSQFKKLLLF